MMKDVPEQYEVQMLYCYGLACGAHAGQYRKYTDQYGQPIPYTQHLEDVATNLEYYADGILEQLDYPEMIFKMMMAAFLHDTLEDTHFVERSLQEALNRMNIDPMVFEMVRCLTNEYQEAENITRNEKLRLYINQLRESCKEVRILKLLDIMSNTEDAGKGNKEWRRRFVDEKTKMVNAIVDSLPDKPCLEKIETRIRKNMKKLLEE